MRSSDLLIASDRPPAGGNRSDSPGNGASAANGTAGEWGPFGSAATYGNDMALVLGILLSAFFAGLVLLAVFRLFLRRWRGAHPVPAGTPEKSARGGGAAACRGVRAVYAAGATDLAAAAEECAICLTEFADGDALEVLPACRHGFHVECAETWLAVASSTAGGAASAPSCPVCRASCRPLESPM